MCIRDRRQPGGLFSGRSEMARFCHDHADAGFDGNYCREYGFRINTQQYSYLLRCHANPGDYNFYLFAYMTEHLDRHMENAGRGIRFITPDYKELFRIPDGDKAVSYTHLSCIQSYLGGRYAPGAGCGQ